MIAKLFVSLTFQTSPSAYPVCQTVESDPFVVPPNLAEASAADALGRPPHSVCHLVRSITDCGISSFQITDRRSYCECQARFKASRENQKILSRCPRMPRVFWSSSYSFSLRSGHGTCI